MTAIGRWTSSALRMLEALLEREAEHLETAANWCADSIASGGLVHLFGTGHSRMTVEEMFPRYGSFPGFHPIVELSMTFHTQVVGANGQRQAMFIERQEGLAEVILRNFNFGPSDTFMIVSNSGTTAVPIEVALGAKARGLKVIALTGVAHSTASPSGHSSGTKLLDHADLVIDLGTTVGDAMVKLDGLDTPVGPGSTLTGVQIVNEIKVRTAELLVAAGQPPIVLTSGAVVGSARSDELFNTAYDEYSRRLARVLTPPAGA
ncbi:MAG: SIS domain-containing protein [Propionicimonas sp.]|uniref:SIS domain-containing protein n=1 Tax=Propionicimonas sp. TaxID=1955623 RepID=UPI002B2126CA|nr:SIS domain-containing protein [Propionicimonas sp.]MEA4943323.1 SIS domain-containing protein [Propionicimonas sp.]MEA5054103.1 SIS domain-containing protein [Propionicimonas sp.]MEA5118760.1 SIS domain-containing protein [Propionicimonas sp.]